MHIEPQDVVLLAGVAFASATDLRSTRIPNVLTFPMMAVGIGANLAAGDPWRGVLGVAAAFALHFPLFAAGIGRAGDAKLMMAVGAFLGWAGVIETTAWLAILYVPVALGVLALRGRLGNLAATAKYTAERAAGRDPGEAPQATWLVTGPIIAVATALAWGTDWLERLV